jgi:hypothetical protein
MSSFVVEQRSYALSSSDASEVQDGLYTFNDFSYLSRPRPPSVVYETLTLARFSCLNGFYTVTDQNNALVVDMTRLVIPSGWYTVTTLCAQVQTLMRTVRAQATCTYNASTGQVTLASGDTYNLTILGPPATTCGALLGMSGITYSGAKSYLLENLVDLQPLRAIVVSSNILTQNRRVSNGASFLASIPMEAAPGALISYTGDQECMLQAAAQTTFQLQFQDQSGAPLTFRTPWELLLTHTLYHAPAAWVPPPEAAALLSASSVYEEPVDR